MKSLIFSLLLLLPVFCSSQTKWFFETNSRVGWESGEIVPQINSAMIRPISKKVSLTSFMIAHKGFGKGFLGIGYSPVEGLSLDLKVGMRTPGVNLQVKPTVIFANKKLFLFGTLEIGEDEKWYLLNGVYKTPIGKYSLNTGFEARRNNGLGPLLQVSRGVATLWVIPVMYDHEKQRGKKLGTMAGVKLAL